MKKALLIALDEQGESFHGAGLALLHQLFDAQFRGVHDNRAERTPFRRRLFGLQKCLLKASFTGLTPPVIAAMPVNRLVQLVLSDAERRQPIIPVMTPAPPQEVAIRGRDCGVIPNAAIAAPKRTKKRCLATRTTSAKN